MHLLAYYNNPVHECALTVGCGNVQEHLKIKCHGKVKFFPSLIKKVKLLYSRFITKSQKVKYLKL